MSRRGSALLAVVAVQTSCSGGTSAPPPDAASGSAHAPTMLAALDRPFAIAVTGGNVYALTASSAGSGELVSIPTTGGAPTVMASGLSTFEVYGHALAVDATTAYFLTGVGVSAVPIGGGSASAFAQPPRGVDAIAVDATNVYLATGGSGASDGAIAAVPLGGGSATTVATGPRPIDVAVDASRVYWGGMDGTLDAAPKSGGSAVALGSGDCLPDSVAVDATTAYWLCSSGDVFGVPLAGGSATLLDAFDGGQPDGMNGLAIDATSVYWTQTDGDVDRVPLGGETGQGNPLLASGSGTAWGIATDGAAVYWVIDATPGAVMRVAL